MELWYTEEHTDKVRFSIKVDEQLYSGKSDFQRIDVFKSQEFGTFFTLDGLMMVTEKDEFIYHDMIVHVPMATNPNIKNVLVIGGGVGGMQAAWVSALRGHNVTLVEKSYTLGGQMRLAAYPPGKGDITNLVRNFIARCNEYGVKVLLNTEATEEFVKEMNPDVCIVATGATPLVLPIPGINDVGVINAIDLLDGQKACGTKVLVVGGGMVGAETAEFLAEQEHEVSIIEFKDKIAGDVAKEHRKYIMEAFDKHKVESITGAKVAEFYTDGVKYELADGSVHEVRGFDSVVLAMGSRNYDPISESLKDIVKETYVIGDAVRARRALNATEEALNVALSI